MVELLTIFALILFNALLSGAEMAVVSSRRAKLQAAADRGSRRARAALRLRNDPERFLATVQIFLTLVGAIAGVYGGSALAGVLTPIVEQVPAFATVAQEVSKVLVVCLITYLSVVVGELIPKSLALRYAEPIATVLARPVQVLEVVARPMVWLLMRSSNLVLRAFHDSTTFVESKLAREDLAAMVSEATTQSELSPTTRRVFEHALEFSTLKVGDVMVPRRWVVALPKDASVTALKKALVAAGHRRVPVYEGSIDGIAGYLLRDDVLAVLWDGKPIDLPAMLRPAYFVPESMPAERALRELQARRLHLAVVVDEHGSVQGIVTLEDLLEELVGEIYNERDVETFDAAKKEADGAWLVQGNLDVRAFTRISGIDLDEPDEARSMGGLVVHLAGGSLPDKGAIFAAGNGTTLEAAEVSVRRVRMVRVRRSSS
ncbi:MAG TPA: hemolysin family protein [Planctomycetota bacterium]|nr:hemolysin family protein [Planctomycetota bacterium]